MRVGQVFRYADKKVADPAVEFIDDLPNFYHATNTPGATMALLEKGINSVGRVRGPEGLRTPVVLIRSSPHKRGRQETPWEDIFDTDSGHIRYFGDNKPRRSSSSTPWTVSDAWEAPGNKALAKLFKDHKSPRREVRLQASPLLFFEAVSMPGRVKGQIRFHGFGLIDAIQVVTQHHPESDLYFSNLVFDLVVLNLDDEGTGFDWNWIRDRRDHELTNFETLTAAPKSWREWVDAGDGSVPRLRRSVARFGTQGRESQMPAPGSKESAILEGVYDFYSEAWDKSTVASRRLTARGGSVGSSKTRFEMLASFVAERVLRSSGADYESRWITRGTGDEGVDFVGRMRIGIGFSSTDLVVLGQAKCEQMTNPTNGVHIARTVARLQRGWLGVYVTTSYFSMSAQREVAEDRYPMVLIPGGKVADVIRTELHERSVELIDFLRWIDDQYDETLSYKRPHEVLLG